MTQEELWQPMLGEWCWFYNLEKDEATLGQFNWMEDFFGKVKYGTKSEDFYDFIEPFVGKLPTFLKAK